MYWCHTWNSIDKFKVKRFTPCVLPGFFLHLLLICKPSIHLELIFCIWCEFQFILLHGGIQLSQHHLFKRPVLATLLKNQLTIDVWIHLLASWFYSTDVRVYPYASTMLLDYYGFAESLKLGCVSLPTLFLFCKTAFTILFSWIPTWISVSAIPNL